jgi:hypothetical protein
MATPQPPGPQRHPCQVTVAGNELTTTLTERPTTIPDTKFTGDAHLLLL